MTGFFFVQTIRAFCRSKKSFQSPKNTQENNFKRGNKSPRVKKKPVSGTGF
jgi:hypothetical protein